MTNCRILGRTLGPGVASVWPAEASCGWKRLRAAPLTWALALASLAAPSVSHAQLLGVELIVNGDAETGDTSGWTNVAGSMTTLAWVLPCSCWDFPIRLSFKH